MKQAYIYVLLTLLNIFLFPQYICSSQQSNELFEYSSAEQMKLIKEHDKYSAEIEYAKNKITNEIQRFKYTLHCYKLRSLQIQYNLLTDLELIRHEYRNLLIKDDINTEFKQLNADQLKILENFNNHTKQTGFQFSIENAEN